MKSHALFTLTVFCRLSLSSENAFDDLKECGFAGVFFSELADGHVRLGVVGHQTLRDVDEGILEFIHAFVVQARGIVDHQLKTVLAVKDLHIQNSLRRRLILADDPALDARYAQELAQWRAGLAAHWRALVSAKALPANRVLLMTALRFAYGLTSALMRCGKRGAKMIWGK